MSDRELDLTDPTIREMAERNHTPAEVWTMGGNLASVHCDTCGHPWPCPIIVRLRDLRT